MSRRLAAAVAAVEQFLHLLPWWRSRLCKTGARPCYECTAYDRVLTKARGGATRQQWLAAAAAEAAQAEAVSSLRAAVLR